MKRCVFLDRDGVLNEAIVKDGKPYPPHHVADVVVMPGAPQLLQALRDQGFLLVVVTNQPDVARGTATCADVNAINNLLQVTLPIDAFYTCYHDDKDHCLCRKPKPGALLKAAEDLNIDLRQSFMIGDRWRDITAGKEAGCRTVWIDYQYDEKHPTNYDYRAKDLQEAVSWILSSHH